MRVEVAEHALDGVFQQGLVVHRFDIGRLDAVHHLGEGAQFIQRQGGLGVFHRGRHRLGRGLQGGAARQQAEGQGERGEAVEMRHVNSQEKLRVALSGGQPRHHCAGSLGRPCWRMAKYRAGVSCPPLVPTVAIDSPALTISPASLSRLWLWP
ncbi:hypothetical protein D3C78_1545700 [compost metagenome]